MMRRESGPGFLLDYTRDILLLSAGSRVARKVFL